jgi:hypothetical protein
MGTRLISNEEVGIGAMVPPGLMLGFIYVGQGEGCMGEGISTKKCLGTKGVD